MKLMVAVGKIGVLAIWFWGILAFLTPTMVPAPDVGRMVFFGLLAVHVAEALVFAKGLSQDTGESLGKHRGHLLIFGYFHVLGVRYSS